MHWCYVKICKVYGLSLYNSRKNWYNDVRYFVERRGIHEAAPESCS